MADIGKVGNLRFSLAKSDTIDLLSITQAGGRNVTIPSSEFSEIELILDKFATEMEKKVNVTTVISDKTKTFFLSCSYFKQTGWSVMIQHADPAFQQAAEKIRQSTGYGVYYFVEIKPKQIAEVVKIFSKVAGTKAI